MNLQILNVIQIILGVMLIGLILLQSKGTGLGSTFGGDMGFYGTKRGAEKMIFNFTIVVAVVFFISSLLGVILSK
jgi:protein translocase SecG subunit